MSVLDHCIPPPLVAALVAVGMYATARAWPIAALPLPHPVAIGSAVATIGVAVAVAGAWAFRRAGTTVDPLHPERASRIVSSGVFRYSRNPMYLGMLIVLAGWALALDALGALAGLPLFLAYIGRFQIAPEERALQVRFGAEFELYCRRVRRWL